MPAKQTKIIAETQHVRLVDRDGWQYVQRNHASGVVTVLALTDQRQVLFVEQFRPPVNARVIEFPAGLAGDLADAADEPLEEAARRELLEETGYEAKRLERIFEGPSSAGLTDEIVTFFLADELRKVAGGGGVGHEQIVVHEVPLVEAHRWLASKQTNNCLVDARVYAGLYFLQLSGGT